MYADQIIIGTVLELVIEHWLRCPRLVPCSPRCRASPALHLIRASQQSYYDVLGVPKDADLKQIKQAFKRKALKLHPDVNTAVRHTLCIEWLDNVPSLVLSLTAQILQSMPDEAMSHCSRMQRSASWSASMHIRPCQTPGREAAMTGNRCCLTILHMSPRFAPAA